MQFLGTISNITMISVHFQGKPFNIIVIQVCAPITNAEEAEVEQFYDDLQDLLELTPKKRCSSHYREPEWKSRKSRERKKIGENSRLFRFDLNQMSKKKCEKKKGKNVKEKRKDIPI